MSARSLAAVVCLGLVSCLTYGQAPQAQRGTPAPTETPSTARSRPVFEGVTEVQVNARRDSIRVDIRLWSIPGRQRLSSLTLPFRGFLIVELRGGDLITIINGQRIVRRGGDIWSVPSGSVMQLETSDDTASLQTTLIAD